MAAPKRTTFLVRHNSSKSVFTATPITKYEVLLSSIYQELTTTMKIFIAFISLLAAGCAAFTVAPSHGTSPDVMAKLGVGYVPDGMSPDQWRKLQEKERKAKGNKDLGSYGPSSFKSRSLKAFQQVGDGQSIRCKSNS